MAANNARGAAKPTRAAYAASYSRGGGGGAGDGRVTARGEGERGGREEGGGDGRGSTAPGRWIDTPPGSRKFQPVRDLANPPPVTDGTPL